MRFAYTDDQLALRDAVGDLLRSECPPGVVRAAWENADGRRPELWAHLVAMGVPGLLVPEDSGGLGFGEVELVAVAEEFGRVALPEPASEVAAAGAPLLAATGEAGAGWLGRVVAGEAAVACGLAGEGDLLHGATADVWVLESDGGVILAEPGQVDLHPRTSVDRSRRLAAVMVRPGVGPVLGGREAAEALARARARITLATAAELCGLAGTMLSMAVDYAGERRQFGVPIGSQQAVKHQLADAELKLSFARPVVRRAAWSLSVDDPEASLHVSMAKAAASDAALFVAGRALQVHGAIGYTVEYDLHLYLKRARALASRYGTATAHRREIAARVLTRPGSPGGSGPAPVVP